MSYLYQLAVGKANNEKKKFLLERDLIFTEKPLTKEDIHDISNTHKCDVMVSFLGELKKPEEHEIFDYRVDYHTKPMVEAIREQWKKEETSENTNNTVQ